MKIIDIKSLPSQNLNLTLDGSTYNITIKETSGVMSMTIERDNVLIVQNQRVVSGSPVIPYKYLERGNFIFVTQNFEYPYYPAFGVTQFLFYLTQDELANIRARKPRFDPSGDVPIRYKPEEYEYVYLATEDGELLTTETEDSFILGGAF